MQIIPPMHQLIQIVIMETVQIRSHIVSKVRPQKQFRCMKLI